MVNLVLGKWVKRGEIVTQILNSRIALTLVGNFQYLIQQLPPISSQVIHLAKRGSTRNAYVQCPCKAIGIPWSLSTTVFLLP